MIFVIHILVQFQYLLTQTTLTYNFTYPRMLGRWDDGGHGKNNSNIIALSVCVCL